MTLVHGSKTWAGANPIHIIGSRGSSSAWMLSDDDKLLGNLAAQAWREDPTPLGVDRREPRSLK